MRTSELTGAALDWAVAKCEGKEAARVQGLGGAVRLFKTVGYDPTPWQPSTDWAQGGPIIEREEINLLKRDDNPWHGYAYRFGKHKKMRGQRGCEIFRATGPTPLIAAMRCYVASKLGDEVEIPTELTGESK